jgi:katanin p80 WD40 repeat-containing subunit B1
MDATLNASQFMLDEKQREKFKQFDTINDILKESGKFSEVLNFRMSRVKPIINWWTQNNIKSALYALNE